MRSRLVSTFVLAVLVAVSAARPLRAEDTATGCDVTSSLLESDSSLPKVAAAVKEGRSLDVLVIGSRSSTLGSDPSNAYPARMQAALKEKLPQLTVTVSVEIQASKTAEEVGHGLVRLMEGKKPALVIWQTGTVDAMRSIDPDEFRNAVDEGVVALQNAGSDVVLMNPQYSPRTETMISVPPYLDNLRAVAQSRDVPLFDRFAVMRQWNEQGDFDLFSAHRSPEFANRVHNCIGRALSAFVIDAAHLGPAQQN